jgi:hypothetical protein
MNLSRLAYTQHPRPPQRDLRQRGDFDSERRLIGYVANIYVDDDRNFRFVDVAVGGFMGLGQNHHFVPVEVIADEDHGSITLTVDRQSIESAPKLSDLHAAPEDETLYLRVATMRTLEGEFDRMLRFIDKTMIPVTEMQEEFCGGGLISDRRANKIVTLSWWTSQPKMQATERCEHLPDEITRLLLYLAELPKIENYQLDAII